MDKALAELEILCGFIDFVNRQVGVYMDCLAGFEGNTVRLLLREIGLKPAAERPQTALNAHLAAFAAQRSRGR